jgi:hypothetical protein
VAHGIEHFLGSVSPGNAPSVAVLERLGFAHTGEQWDDEDGRELVYELQLEPGAPWELSPTPPRPWARRTTTPRRRGRGPT